MAVFLRMMLISFLKTKNRTMRIYHIRTLKAASIKQLLDEVEHDIMNYQNRGLCYLPNPKAEAETLTRGFDNS